MKRLDYYWYRPFENKRPELLAWYRRSGILASSFDFITIYITGKITESFYGNDHSFPEDYYFLIGPVMTVVIIKNIMNKRK
jgi:hypothetical protein